MHECSTSLDARLSVCALILVRAASADTAPTLCCTCGQAAALAGMPAFEGRTCSYDSCCARLGRQVRLYEDSDGSSQAHTAYEAGGPRPCTPLAGELQQPPCRTRRAVTYEDELAGRPYRCAGCTAVFEGTSIQHVCGQQCCCFKQWHCFCTHVACVPQVAPSMPRRELNRFKSFNNCAGCFPAGTCAPGALATCTLRSTLDSTAACWDRSGARVWWPAATWSCTA